jgi:UDP-2,3-diacylglucosamine hydrolase
VEGDAGDVGRKSAGIPGGRSRVFFISDCHLGHDATPSDRDRETWVLRFLDSLDPERDALAIVGDLFDFWFAYRRAIPRAGFAVLAGLLRLRQAGMPITFVAGNHDYWALPFMRDDLGIEVVDGILARPIQGRRFFIAHGDGLGAGDLGYKLIKRVLRNPSAIALYRLIHPDLGIQLATLSSRLSRRYSAPEPHLADRFYDEIAVPAFRAGHDVVILGHLHLPTLREEGGKAMVILGDWLANHTFLRLEDGKLHLERFTAEE